MMSRNWGWPHGGTGGPAAGARRRRTTPALGFDHLEGRLLLQGDGDRDTPVPDQRMLRSGGAVYTIAVNGPGFVKAHPGRRGLFNVSLFGTTPESQVTVTLTRSPPVHRLPPADRPARRPLGPTGVVPGAGTADLLGRMTRLRGPVNALQFNALGPDARIDVQGSLGTLDVSQGVNLGPTGMVHVSGDVTA